MIENRKLAVTAYSSLVEQLAELQQRIVLRRLIIAEFGSDALPLHEMLRRMGRQDALATAPETLAKEDARDRERASEIAATIRSMEEVFGRIHAADDEAFAHAFAEHVRAERRKEKRS
jgi:hypothetical protein